MATDTQLCERGSGWTLDIPENRPTVDPALIETWKLEAPFNDDAAALYEWATTPEGR